MLRMTFALSLLAATAACTQDNATPAAQTQAPTRAQAMPDWANAISHTVDFDAAGNAVKVQVTVKDGFHAYTVGETTGKPLLLKISDDSEYALAGAVNYPKGKVKELPVGTSVIVEGQAQVTASVKAKTETAKTLRGSFKYQVCSNEACDRPRTKKFEISAK